MAGSYRNGETEEDFRRKTEEVHALKEQIQELNFESGENVDNVRDWTEKIEGKLAEFENAIRELKHEQDRVKGEEHLKLEQTKFERRMEHEKALSENREKSTSGKNGGTKLTTKLPKLVITKFTGQHTDWLRFWGQFTAEIDNSDVSSITKFSYLNELVEPKVLSCIDGLPFTSEGYERAKNILTTKYGKTSEIINAYVQNIINLPNIQGTKPGKIHAFYETLLTSVQSLETLGKLKEVSGYVRMTIDKLEGIRSDLVRIDDDWQEWRFPEFIEALRKWTVRNPVKQDDGSQDRHSKSRSFQVRQQESRIKGCVYCNDTSHRSAECKKVVSVSDRRRILGEKKLCFNCMGPRHKASECRSQQTCQHCKRRHHSSICDKRPNEQEGVKTQTEQMLVAKGENKVIYPIVLVKVDGIICRALLDTGAGSSYASGALVERLNKRPVRKVFKRIEMMMQSTSRIIEVHEVTISDLDEKHKLKTEVTKVDRNNLLLVDNPKYEEVLSKFDHLKKVKMDDTDAKPQLPVHLILGASDYAKIKTATEPCVGEPGARTEEDLTKSLFARSSMEDYRKLCDLDVLGLEDQSNGDETIYQDFKDQLIQSPEGWYETGLLYKPTTSSLPSNKAGSLARLGKLVKRLEKKPRLFEQYQQIMKEQEEQGIIEKVTHEAKGREFYLPHKPVVRESAESTKVRVVYDVSAKESEDSPSLNDCLETGPILQNLLWNVLVSNWFKPVALSADLKQAFLQIRIKQKDRDVLRFHWLSKEDPKQVEVYRFTRALFGLNQSPFLLAETLNQHLNSQEQEFPKEVAEIRDSLYVDDLLTGGCMVEEVQQLKGTAIKIFDRAKFTLHKWHSNLKELEASETVVSDAAVDQSYANQRLGVRENETKLLGMPWNKSKDTIGVNFPEKFNEENVTKRIVLSEIASIFDSLDASGQGTSAAVYAVILQGKGIGQGLITAKSRLAKKGLTIPRLELVSAQMATRLMDNVRSVLEGLPVRHCVGWLDSMVALYWINGSGNYKQFVANRVKVIREKNYISWKHVGTKDNPADIGSRGCNGDQLSEKWLEGPKWLPDPEK
ncbi:uncharacterized protein LOC124440389 [Xenia sp. Carnegie-2017]|uniref:uncharacterized protein LOC124440389 n=1 Tax=Xenia sp. Carnegie-2017 TaxID=2897299 RepID=UPI001F04A4A4|nr:uncharacterized protein LOC124440389 [Xenia sp. Carnegie-2017]